MWMPHMVTQMKRNPLPELCASPPEEQSYGNQKGKHLRPYLLQKWNMLLAHTGMEIRWFWNLYSELGLPMTSPIKIRCDNLGAKSMSENPFITQKLQHFDLKYHSI